MNLLVLLVLTWTLQTENARAVMDLYRSHATEWESTISKEQWPCDLPPDTFSGCFL